MPAVQHDSEPGVEHELCTRQNVVADLSQPASSHHDSFEKNDAIEAVKNANEPPNGQDVVKAVERCVVEKDVEADGEASGDYCVPNMHQIKQEYSKMRKNTHLLKMNYKQLEENLDHFMEHNEFKKYPAEENTKEKASVGRTKNSNESDGDDSVSTQNSEDSFSTKSKNSRCKRSDASGARSRFYSEEKDKVSRHNLYQCGSEDAMSTCYSEERRKTHDASEDGSMICNSPKGRRRSGRRECNSKYDSPRRRSGKRRDDKKPRRSLYEQPPRKSRAYKSPSSEQSYYSSSESGSVEPRRANFDKKAKFAIDKPSGYQENFGVKKKTAKLNKSAHSRKTESGEDCELSVGKLNEKERDESIEESDEFGGYFDKYGHYWCEEGGYTTEEGGYHDGKGGYYHADGGFTDQNGIFYEGMKRKKKRRSKRSRRRSCSSVSLQQRQYYHGYQGSHDYRGYQAQPNQFHGNYPPSNPYCFYHHYMVGAPPPCLCVPNFAWKNPAPATPRSLRKRPESRSVSRFTRSVSRWSSASCSFDSASFSKHSDRMVRHSVRKPMQYKKYADRNEGRENIYESTTSEVESDPVNVPGYELTGREFPVSKGLSTANDRFTENILAGRKEVDPAKAFEGVYEHVLEETRKRVEYMFGKKKE